MEQLVTQTSGAFANIDLVWDRQLQPSDVWRTRLKEMIDQCDAVVVMATRALVERDSDGSWSYVWTDEVPYALIRGVPVTWAKVTAVPDDRGFKFGDQFFDGVISLIAASQQPLLTLDAEVSNDVVDCFGDSVLKWEIPEVGSRHPVELIRSAVDLVASDEMRALAKLDYPHFFVDDPDDKTASAAVLAEPESTHPLGGPLAVLWRHGVLAGVYLQGSSVALQAAGSRGVRSAPFVPWVDSAAVDDVGHLVAVIAGDTLHLLGVGSRALVSMSGPHLVEAGSAVHALWRAGDFIEMVVSNGSTVSVARVSRWGGALEVVPVEVLAEGEALGAAARAGGGMLLIADGRVIGDAPPLAAPKGAKWSSVDAVTSSDGTLVAGLCSDGAGNSWLSIRLASRAHVELAVVPVAATWTRVVLPRGRGTETVALTDGTDVGCWRVVDLVDYDASTS